MSDAEKPAEQPTELMKILGAFDQQHNKTMQSMQNFVGVMTKDMATKLGQYMTGLYTTLENQSQELVLHRTFEAGIRNQILSNEDVQLILSKLLELRKTQAEIARKFISEANATDPKQQG